MYESVLLAYFDGHVAILLKRVQNCVRRWVNVVLFLQLARLLYNRDSCKLFSISNSSQRNSFLEEHLFLFTDIKNLN